MSLLVPEGKDLQKIKALEAASSLKEAAENLGVETTTIGKLRQRLEEKYEIRLPRYKGFKGSGADHGVPFSEDEGEFHEDWNAERCMEELNILVRRYPDKVISRNFLRIQKIMSESTWNRHFGTFLEFKRQADVTLSRQQHALERDIARHASVDHYRVMNQLKADWGDTYSRPDSKRFQTIMVINDLHDKNVDSFWLDVMLDTAKRVQPEIISINGDLFDLPEFGKYFVDPRQWDAVGRIKFVHDRILRPLREACPDAQIDLNEGNHEFRLLRHLSDATPALKVVLSDLHGMTIPQLLGLDEFELNYHSVSDLAAKTVKDIKDELLKNYKAYHGCFITHHYPQGVKYGMPGCNAHHHKHLATSLYSEIFGSYEWHQVACGHMRAAEFCNGLLWQMGFLLAHIDTHKKYVQHEHIVVGESMAVVGGQYYVRSIDDE